MPSDLLYVHATNTAVSVSCSFGVPSCVFAVSGDDGFITHLYLWLLFSSSYVCFVSIRATYCLNRVREVNCSRAHRFTSAFFSGTDELSIGIECII